MQNIKDEFIKHIGNRIIKCAEIMVYNGDFMENCPDSLLGNERAIMSWVKERSAYNYYLGIDDTREDYQFFLNALDIPLKKDKRMLGTIWYTDGSWSSYCYDHYDDNDEIVDEYSYWKHIVAPKIPEICKAIV